MFFRIILSLVIGLVFVDCTDDKKIFDSGLLWVETYAVQVPVAEGAVFQATLFDPKQLVTELGFVWALLEDPITAADTEKIKAELTGQNSFSVHITSNINARALYYVRGYAICGGTTIYGNVTTFLGVGSKGPVISDFTPKSARGYDTIAISGSGFGSVIAHNTVMIGSATALVTYASPSLIKAVVPFFLPEGQLQVSVSSGGQQTTATEKLQFRTALPWQVANIDKTFVRSCDLITFTFNKPLEPTFTYTVMFNNTESSPARPNGNKLTVFVPSLPPTPTVALLLKTGTRLSDHPTVLPFNEPQIVSFSPSTFSPLAEITVTGQNLGFCISVRINGLFIQTTDVRDTGFKFKVPSELIAPYKVDLYNGGFLVATYNFN